MRLNHNPYGNRLIGTKFYTYHNNDTEATVYRLTKIKKTDTDTIYTLTNVIDHKTRRLTAEELTGPRSTFVMLNPDAIMNFSIVELEGSDITKDVIITLHSIRDLDKTLPMVVCRMMIEDLFINQTVLHDKYKNFFIGMSVTPDTCPAGVNYEQSLMCKEVSWMASSAVYLDDTLEDIAFYIEPGINGPKFDRVLNNIKTAINYHNPNIKGACGSLQDLMKDNHFMDDFERSFGIVSIPMFNVGEYLAATCLGDVETINRYHTLFEHATSTKVSKLYPLKYSRDFSLSNLKRKFMLVRPKDVEGCTDLYVIGYDEPDDTFYPNGQSY